MGQAPERGFMTPLTSFEADMMSEEKDSLLLSTPPENANRRPRRCKYGAILSAVALALLLVITLAQTVSIAYMQQKLASCTPAFSRLGRHVPHDQTRLIGLPNAFYNGSSLEPQNSAWDKIDGGGHGIVALSPEFVAKHNLAATIDHPYNASKKVYALEAYHLIHCLERIRKDYLSLYRNETPGKPLEHDLHCFDAIRQSIMCQASDELLIITGFGHARGYNQTVMCRNWDDLRNFATAHTACYRDEPPAWDACDGGADGLPVGSLLG